MRNLLSKISNGVKQNQADIILVIGVVLISLISFGGGWLLGNSSDLIAKEEIKIEEVPLEKLQASPKSETDSKEQKTNDPKPTEQSSNNIKEQKPSSDENQQQFVGSKNGSVYHYPLCGSAQQIKEENKIYFDSKEEAEKAGYRPAKNCPGL